MTSSYVFLVPPDGQREDTLTIRDGFSWLAFLFPWIWLLAHRLWLHAIIAFALQAIGGVLAEESGFGPAGMALAFAVNLFVGFEGQNFRIRNLASRGWREEAAIGASSIDLAEEIYFSNIETGADLKAPEWNQASGPQAWQSHSTSLGLFGFDGGRK
ncbi:DUF2628 domain-containing protein [Rhizobium sp. CF142]|uniref:DUF2628 domain-containing protein n=1 Tax=Rhizobium sp. CF142 TaxID=1144314 RepID=UPI00026EECDD|nr:DUF2628 domain-containing protein [Rhizobium sp. CF142]EJJ30819.1 Protein of unknown function (DUF2628) [Rhizobium sp. CF142]